MINSTDSGVAEMAGGALQFGIVEILDKLMEVKAGIR